MCTSTIWIIYIRFETLKFEITITIMIIIVIKSTFFIAIKSCSWQ